MPGYSLRQSQNARPSSTTQAPRASSPSRLQVILLLTLASWAMVFLAFSLVSMIFGVA